MLKIQKYTKVKNLDEAYAILNKNRNNIILGGMMWLKMSTRMINEAIDLSDLGYNLIEEKDDEFQIGCMCTLRQLELHESLNQLCQNMLKDALCDIVGVQFRNMATIGGSIYSRFGFSDILTALLALDCDVVLYRRGRISLEEFAKMPYEKDILTHICIKKRPYQGTFMCVRKSATDLSVLNLAMTKNHDDYRIAIGARPQKARCITVSQNLSHNKIIEIVKENLLCQSNMRASQQYREKLEEALLLKAFCKLEDK